jgi:hypothetical protein
MLAVSQLQARDLAGDHAAAGVGEERRHPVPVDVGEGELRARMGAFLAQDQPRPFRHDDRSIMPVASATQAPSRSPRLRSPGASTGGDQIHDGLDALIDREPEGELHPSLRQAAANRCVAPAESERASTRGEPGSPGRGRACSGSYASAIVITVTWSVAVLLPALPARSRPASASPPATSGRSKKASSGPNVFFQVAAAFCSSSVGDADRGVEVDPQLTTALRRRARLPGALAGRPRRTHPRQVRRVDPVQQPFRAQPPDQLG